MILSAYPLLANRVPLGVRVPQFENPFPMPSISVFQLGWEKGRVQTKLGTIWHANDQNSGTIQCANNTKLGSLERERPWYNDKKSGTIQHANETRSGHNYAGDR